MALIDRLGGFGEDGVADFRKISPDAFWATLYELSQGNVTKAQIVAYFALSANEESELQWIIDRYNAQPNSTAKAKFVELIRVLLILAESGVPGYTTNSAITARINAI